MSARTLPSRLALAAGATLALGLLGGCASTVSSSDIEEQITTQLGNQGLEAENVDCPEDLDAEEGATTTCTLEAEGEEYDVAIEVTGVDGDNVNFSIQVADEPN
ncbi:DUF4333 domain-containing protein [Nocardioides sp. CFH 31398]|uniref:DUF4333 domain-containing protein n=1 Tax=Nocardioides sp. CFH 31398 TaxID=2919579 RepID=UPI001F069D87|nr:DUF4333 domain-containing protein [Nocardioides sp. CFH 31398]MCH1865417.1 DUF4333 domain-containing protein [Nocardioides sp. CFH 31398]